MSNKEISRYFTKEDGTTFSSDTELLGLSVNSKVKNKNSGYTFKKTSSNVFDKTPIETEIDAVLYTSQTLTDAQKTQARTNIGAGKSESVLYTSQTLTDEQKTQARNNIGASSSSAVLYTAQSLTDAQKAQARNNIGAGSPTSDAVLYTAQTLTNAQKQQARNNIGALATSDLPVGSKLQKGILQVGSGINVSSGVISVDDEYIRELVGGVTPEIKEAIYSEVSVFGINTHEQKSVVGQSYAGSKLYTTTSTSESDTSVDYALKLSEPLSGTWKCVTASSVKCNRQTSETSSTRYSFEVKRGSFIKV